MKKLFLLFLALPIYFAASLILAPQAEAATMNFFSASNTFKTNDSFKVDIKIDSGDQGINGAQATIQFDATVLEVTATDKTTSIFNFWIRDPSIDNTNGKVSFLAGSTSGYTGKSLEALNITFRAKGPGKTTLVFNDAAITAADGSGTNVLTTEGNLPITVSAGTTSGQVSPSPAPAPAPAPAPTPVPPGAPPAAPVPVPVTPPTQIIRPATPASGSPVKPVVSVPLYPDPAKWNNVSANFFASWKLPTDVTDVAAVINKTTDFSPTVSEGLFESKSFFALPDGISYLHVRFKNQIGWGPVNNYRLAVDTTPPAGFNITFEGGTPTDNPAPVVNYKSSDSLSGLDHYAIRIDNNSSISTDKDIYTLPLQAPGKHTIIVKAYDAAGNATQNDPKQGSFEIIPIASPVITTLTKDNFVGEGNFGVGGTTAAGTVVLLTIQDQAGNAVLKADPITPDASGNWSFRTDQLSKQGIYYVSVVSQDARGAQSLPVKSASFAVRQKPLLTIFGIEITQFWFFVGLVMILLTGFAFGYISQKLQHEQRERKVLIAKRDVNTAFELIKKDVDAITKIHADKTALNEAELAEVNHFLIRINDNLLKMKKYLSENIEQIEN